MHIFRVMTSSKHKKWQTRPYMRNILQEGGIGNEFVKKKSGVQSFTNGHLIHLGHMEELKI